MKTTRLVLGVIAAASAWSMAAVAHGETVVNNGGPSIQVLDNQTANPYPAELTVEGADGPVADVNVTLTLSHAQPDDLDIAIVSPENVAVVLMSDACGAVDFNNTVIRFDSEASQALPMNNCTSGTFLPTEAGPATFPSPGPQNTTSLLPMINGSDPNGQWRLFVVDDATNDVGSIASWGLTITTQPAETVIPAGPATSGIASPYPSTKNFPAPDGQVITDADVGVVFNHQHPDDLDMLLQGPGGETVLLTSDACGGDDFRGIWTFDDEALTPMFDNSVPDCTAFRHRPGDFDGNDGPSENLPAPAPGRPYGSLMSVFDGRQGGDWRLFVNDDANGDTGYITDWAMIMTTRPAATTGFNATAVSTAEGQTATLTVTRAPLTDLGPATLNVDVGHSGTDPADIGSVPTQLQFARGETSKTIEIPIKSDFDGEGAEDFAVSLTNPVDDALLTDATSFAVVTIAASPPDNRFTVGEVKRLPNGSATVEVKIPNPGTLATDDAGPKDLLKPIEADASKAGKNVVKVKPAKKAKRKLKRGKKVKLTAQITFTPYDGLANSAEAPVTLKRKR
jgi:subtilisin-like proprotein convertase family protein